MDLQDSESELNHLDLQSPQISGKIVRGCETNTRMVQNNHRDLKHSRQQNTEGTEQPRTPLLSPAERHRRAEAGEEEEEEKKKRKSHTD